MSLTRDERGLTPGMLPQEAGAQLPSEPALGASTDLTPAHSGATADPSFVEAVAALEPHGDQVLVRFNGEDVSVYSSMADAQGWADGAELDGIPGQVEFLMEGPDGLIRAVDARLVGDVALQRAQDEFPVGTPVWSIRTGTRYVVARIGEHDASVAPAVDSATRHGIALSELGHGFAALSVDEQMALHNIAQRMPPGEFQLRHSPGNYAVQPMEPAGAAAMQQLCDKGILQPIGAGFIPYSNGMDSSWELVNAFRDTSPERIRLEAIADAVDPVTGMHGRFLPSELTDRLGTIDGSCARRLLEKMGCTVTMNRNNGRMGEARTDSGLVLTTDGFIHRTGLPPRKVVLDTSGPGQEERGLTPQQLLGLLAECEGPMDVRDGLLWLEDGRYFDLRGIRDAPNPTPAELAMAKSAEVMWNEATTLAAWDDDSSLRQRATELRVEAARAVGSPEDICYWESRLRGAELASWAAGGGGLDFAVCKGGQDSDLLPLTEPVEDPRVAFDQMERMPEGQVFQVVALRPEGLDNLTPGWKFREPVQVANVEAFLAGFNN